MQINKVNYTELQNKFNTNNLDNEKNSIAFKDLLKDALDNVNKLQIESSNYKKMLATGQVDSIHEVMIATEKAGIALQFTLTVTNKVIDAYREIMRMQI